MEGFPESSKGILTNREHPQGRRLAFLFSGEERLGMGRDNGGNKMDGVRVPRRGSVNRCSRVGLYEFIETRAIYWCNNRI